MNILRPSTHVFLFESAHAVADGRFHLALRFHRAGFLNAKSFALHANRAQSGGA
jgi:hypothetical protein